MVVENMRLKLNTVTVPENLFAGKAFAGADRSSKVLVLHNGGIAYVSSLSNMVCTQVFLAVRALAHLIRKTLDMSGCDKNCLLCNGRDIRSRNNLPG